MDILLTLCQMQPWERVEAVAEMVQILDAHELRWVNRHILVVLEYPNHFQRLLVCQFMRFLTIYVIVIAVRCSLLDARTCFSETTLFKLKSLFVRWFFRRIGPRYWQDENLLFCKQWWWYLGILVPVLRLLYDQILLSCDSLKSIITMHLISARRYKMPRATSC